MLHVLGMRATYEPPPNIHLFCVLWRSIKGVMMNALCCESLICGWCHYIIMNIGDYRHSVGIILMLSVKVLERRVPEAIHSGVDTSP